MNRDWLNEDVAIHQITFDEQGRVKNLEEIFAEPVIRIEGEDKEMMGYVLLDKKDAVLIDEDLCWGRMFLQYNQRADGTKTTFFMKTDHTHSERVGRRNYVAW